MKTKKPTYTISLYRTTNGIFPTMTARLGKTKDTFDLKIDYPYKTDAYAKRGIIRLARKMGLIK